MGSGIAGDVCGEFLRNLCEDLAWDYAVSWKIRHQIPLLLSWEDGYWNRPRRKLLQGFALEAAYIDKEADTLSLLEDASGDLLGAILSDLSSLCYSVGNGLVAEVADTGNHCWLSCGDGQISINGEMPSAIPQEWLPQLSAGIKTIVLVPVLPYGVLQLGSLDMVAEDMAVVAHVTERFFSLHNVLSQSRIYLEPEDVQDLLLLPLASCTSDGTDDVFSIIEKNLMCSVDLIEEESMLNFDEISESFIPLEENSSAPTDEKWEGSVFSLEEVETFAECHPGGFYDTAVDYRASSDVVALLNDLGNVLGLSMDWDPEEDFVSNVLPLENGESYNKNEDDYPVEADSGDLTSNSGNSPTEVGHHDSSMEPSANSQKWKHEPEEREDLVEHSVISTVFSTKPRGDSLDSSMSLSKLRGKPDIVNEKDRLGRISSNESDQEKEQTRRMTGFKRKVRASDSPRSRPRPRPRDRQLIQDRVKELRELIPEGSKCSIDALLSQTVRHMLFLRSVTIRAEKLRKCTHPDERAQNQQRDSEIAEEHQSGSTRAVEIAGEQQVCPIVVEDLEYPGLMLIEMLCNEHVLFLDIAEVLRRLELNIVRGTTEARRDNTWASFVVEVSKGFHRIDIFWPLMQLLQRTRNPPPATLPSTIA
ncbi:hypothetical protein MLD38_029833 [Melastoma candidum]|uniref:Uncharacterized protein n=1 Tax=Melastoma candidum TaxID=119954 RepID=A0ACB9NAH6_9MYRT|nr:hypothetical protein MLD38_029833 [Melastoma candidum]